MEGLEIEGGGCSDMGGEISESLLIGSMERGRTKSTVLMTPLHSMEMRN